MLASDFLEIWEDAFELEEGYEHEVDCERVESFLSVWEYLFVPVFDGQCQLDKSIVVRPIAE